MRAKHLEHRGSKVGRSKAAGRGPTHTRPSTLDSRLRQVRLLLCDVDGVLTDGVVLVGREAEVKAFSIQDGMGLALWRRAGLMVGWVSHRPSIATTRRAAELKIDFLHQASSGKVAAIETILMRSRMTWDDVCYIGDDLLDLGALKRAGVAVAVSNGAPEAKALAHYVTLAAGGRGAVRETIELILKAQKRWAELVAGCED